jgi:UDP-N-acetylmuramoyl-tripeptide--D-alanyl-D-alanine ligase
MDMKEERGLSNVIYYGKNGGPNNIISGQLLDSSPLLILEWSDNLEGGSYKVPTHLTGAYNLDNILAAICIGSTFGLTPEEISDGIAGYEPKNNRSQILHTAGNTLICDFYNANPSSMFVAIENMDKMQSGRKVLILGDMFEMGEESAAEHAAVFQKAMEAQVNERIFIGKDFSSVDHASWPMDGTTFYQTAEDAMNGLKAKPIANATVLVKGSRGMALERLVGLL